GATNAGADDHGFGLQAAREEMRDAAEKRRSGLPELARQRIEFELELDRLQSLLVQRDSVCDGLTTEIEQGTRFAAEATSHLAELSRGRVAAPRRPSI